MIIWCILWCSTWILLQQKWYCSRKCKAKFLLETNFWNDIFLLSLHFQYFAWHVYLLISNEPELEFSGLSWAVPSRAGASQFPSWKRAGDFSWFIAFLAQFFLSCFRCIAFLAQIYFVLLLNQKNQTFLEGKVLCTTKKGENKVPCLLKMQMK